MTKQDRAEFKDYCQGVTDAQLHNVYIKEVTARRSAFAAIARIELGKRGLV